MFDHLSAFQTGKEWVAVHSGLAKDSLHVYVGLLILFGSARLLRWPVGSWRPWLVVATIALVGEAWHVRDVLVIPGTPDYWDNWYDL